MRTVIAATLLVAALSTAPQATTCAGPRPAGQVVTPACTYIVEQVDPGVWRDNLGAIWTFIAGISTAVRVNLEDLHLGWWANGK